MLAICLIVASLLAAVLAVMLIPRWQVSQFHLSDKDRLALENECRKTVAQIIGGAAVLAGLYFTGQQLDSTRRALAVSQEGQITDRFTRAVDQVGNDKLQVRIGGIYALAEIAQQTEDTHGTAITSILSAFVRTNAHWRETPLPDSAPDDIQAVLSVLGRQGYKALVQEGPGFVVDLSGADLRRVILEGADLKRFSFRTSHLESADLARANLAGADLIAAHLEDAVLDGAVLRDAKLSGAILAQTSLMSADLTRADFRDADLRSSNLDGAQLGDCHLEGADLRSATGLTQAQLHTAILDNATKLPRVIQ